MRLFGKKKKSSIMVDPSPQLPVLQQTETISSTATTESGTSTGTSPQSLSDYIGSGQNPYKKGYKYSNGDDDNEISKYGYGDETSWGGFGVGTKTCPLTEERAERIARRSSLRLNVSTPEEDLNAAESSEKLILSPEKDSNDIYSDSHHQHRPARQQRRRSSIHFGEGNSSMGNSSTHSTTTNNIESRKTNTGKRHQRRRRSSVTGATPTRSKEVEYAASTQHGGDREVPLWMTFGHAKPYNADELLAEHNISLPTEDKQTDLIIVSPEDKARYGYEDAVPDDSSGDQQASAEAESSNMYGYEDASPDSHDTNDDNKDKDKYGYQDAAPYSHHSTNYQSHDEETRKMYGYDDTFNLSSMPSKSSNKNHRKKSTARRRATIDFVGGGRTQERDELEKTDHNNKYRNKSHRRHRRSRRRSSTTGSTPSTTHVDTTQYGDGAPIWEVFGHSQPYSAKEYLAKFNVSPKDLRNSTFGEDQEEFPSSKRGRQIPVYKDESFRYGYEELPTVHSKDSTPIAVSK